MRGSLAATPWAMTGGGTGFDPHPAISSAVTAAPAAARSSFFMRIRRNAGRRGFARMITLRSSCNPRALCGRRDALPRERSTVKARNLAPTR